MIINCCGCVSSPLGKGSRTPVLLVGVFSVILKAGTAAAAVAAVAESSIAPSGAAFKAADVGMVNENGTSELLCEYVTMMSAQGAVIGALLSLSMRPSTTMAAESHCAVCESMATGACCCWCCCCASAASGIQSSVSMKSSSSMMPHSFITLAKSSLPVLVVAVEDVGLVHDDDVVFAADAAAVPLLLQFDCCWTGDEAGIV